MIYFIIAFAIILLTSLYFKGALWFYPNERPSRTKQKMNLDQKKFLSQYSYYYKVLPIADKSEFEARTIAFVYSKNWVSGGDMNQISENQKIAIASYAVQITFGLRMNILHKFKSIVVYKDEYTSTYSGKKHKGEVNIQGAIVLSWKYFEEGAKNHTDGVNLALHEMAHAFFINNFSSKTYERLAIPKKHFDALFILSQDAIPKINLGKIQSLRKYSATNFQEFFACTMESFFEKPFDLKKELPEIYNCMCNMLKQDPSILYSKLR